MLGIKQEALAVELGDDWNQRKISLLEQKEEIDELESRNATRITNKIEIVFRPIRLLANRYFYREGFTKS